MDFLKPDPVSIPRPLAANPNTLKRQPTGSFVPVSAIGSSRQTLGADKLGMIMSKLPGLEKEALKLPGRKSLMALGVAAGLHAPQEAKAQFGLGDWTARKVLRPLAEGLQGSNKMPALDTSRAATSPVHWITKEHPAFKHYADEIRSGANDSTLKFKGLSVDTTQVGKKLNINVHAADDGGDFTHRLYRIDAVPMKGHGHLRGMEQWVDTANNSDSQKYVAQRTQSWLARAKHSLASK